MDEKIDLLLTEFQEVELRLDRVTKQLNEEAADDRRICRNDNNGRRDRSTNRHTDDDDITHRIKVEAPTFNGVHDSRVFSDWLANMDYYFDWYRISEVRKI